MIQCYCGKYLTIKTTTLKSWYYRFKLLTAKKADNTIFYFPVIFFRKTDLKILNDPYIQFKVQKNGKVEWELPLIFQTHCEVDVTYYPFDQQTCVIELTSWSYTKEELTLAAAYEEVKAENLEYDFTLKIFTSEMFI